MPTWGQPPPAVLGRAPLGLGVGVQGKNPAELRSSGRVPSTSLRAGSDRLHTTISIPVGSFLLRKHRVLRHRHGHLSLAVAPQNQIE